MKFQKLFFVSILSAIFVGFISCVNTNASKSSDTNDIKEKTSESGCSCKRSDIESVAYKFIHEFDRIQYNLDSDKARTISLQGIHDNGNCTWQVEFRVSWPFGNTDGAHPDEYITKTGFCNSNQVYLQ